MYGRAVGTMTAQSSLGVVLAATYTFFHFY